MGAGGSKGHSKGQSHARSPGQCRLGWRGRASVAAACLAEGKEARHEAIAVDDLHSSGRTSCVPPRHRGRLTIRLREACALRIAHFLLLRLGELPRKLLLALHGQQGCHFVERFLEILCVRRLGPPVDVRLIHTALQMMRHTCSFERPVASWAHRSDCRHILGSGRCRRPCQLPCRCRRHPQLIVSVRELAVFPRRAKAVCLEVGAELRLQFPLLLLSPPSLLFNCGGWGGPVAQYSTALRKGVSMQLLRRCHRCRCLPCRDG